MFSGSAQIFDEMPLTADTNQEYPLGFRAETRDGRVFRYGEANATIAAGNLCRARDIIGNHTAMSVQAAAAAGSKEVSVTLGATAASADQYEQGYLVIGTAAGAGHAYLVDTHPAANSGSTLTVTLGEEVRVALTTDSNANLVANPWKEIELSTTTQTSMIVGVAAVAMTDGQFGWFQTRGVASALAGEAITSGQAITVDAGSNGRIQALDSAGEPEIGYALQAGVDDELRAVFLEIE